MDITLRIPLTVGPIHMVGIGGIGMSSIALILHAMGYTVRGSDLNATSSLVGHLRTTGIAVHEGHAPKAIQGAAIVVHSTAIPPDNPELLAAREQGIPVVHRSEMLAEIVRLRWGILVSGTHGKTTTTSIIGQILTTGGWDPTVISGGIIRTINSNARRGRGHWVVVEADESDGSMLRLPGTVAVITNIDTEHLDYWGDLNGVMNGYRQLISQLPFYGFAVVCCDDHRVCTLLETVRDRRLITYGLSPNAAVRAENIRLHPRGMAFDVRINHPLRDSQSLSNLLIPLFGKHNVLNALAAIAVTLEIGVPPETLARALGHFSGVERRLCDMGSVNGVRIIDDYAHHPTEITTSIEGARSAMLSTNSGSSLGRLLVVHQPHRYTRWRDLATQGAQAFRFADEVFITPVYAAGESAINGISATAIANAIHEQSRVCTRVIDLETGLSDVLTQHAKPGDTVLIQGAGSIGTVLLNTLSSLPVKPPTPLETTAHP